jgi:Flagellar protein FliT
MHLWQDLLDGAERERDLAAEGRWEELAERVAERGRLAVTMPPPTPEVAPLLERLAEVQAELTATLTAARDDTSRELAQLRRGQSAVRGYVPASAARGGWVDESH